VVLIRQVIDQATLLREMPEPVRAAFAEAATVRRYRSGQHLWRVGDSGDNLQVVGEGMVHIGTLGPDGEEIVLHVVARGDCMGEPSIYAPNRDRQTHARAVGRTAIVFIPGGQVRAALEANPEAMRLFARRVSEICRAHARRVALAAFHGARGRLAQLILDLAASHGAPAAHGRRIELILSQRTLAGLVSLRRESVNRVIGELERDGALTFERGVITLLKPQILRSALGADGMPR
jgi:CRP/FNR family transcriptional regulator, cyclic AMP receptor protein